MTVPPFKDQPVSDLPLSVQPRFALLQAAAQEAIECVQDDHADMRFIVIAVWHGGRANDAAMAASIDPKLAEDVLETTAKALRKARKRGGR
jgi:hypothetical protein